MGIAALAAGAVLWPLVAAQAQGATPLWSGLSPPGGHPHGTLYADAGGCQSVPQRVRKTVARHFRVDEAKVADRANFADDFKADELDQVELTMALEEEFKIRISDEASENMRTVDDAIKYISREYRC